MDFLKSIFGDKALTYADLEAALKDSKDVKLANLAGGEYVAKDKFSALETERNNLKTQLSEANKAIEDFKGMDVDGIKKAADEWKTKAEKAEQDAKTQLEQLRFDHALDGAISGTKAKNAKAVRALLDMNGLKMNGEEIVGLKEQLEKVKTENSYLFEDDTPAPQFSKGGSGGNPIADSMADARAVMGLPPETK